MTTKTVMGISLATVFAVSMIMTPVFASGHLTLDGDPTYTTKSNSNPKNPNDRVKVSFDTTAPVPLDGSGGAFGYAILDTTSGPDLNDVLVLVTHLGIDDSSFEDPVSGLHTHVLDLTGATTACTDVDSDFDIEVDFVGSLANPAFDPDLDWSVDGTNVKIGYVPTKTVLIDGESVVPFTVTPIPDAISPTNLCVDIDP